MTISPQITTIFKPLFYIPASIYYAIQKSREIAFKKGLFRPEISRIPIISIGNIVLGGSGKTPMTIYCAELLLKHGFKPAIVSRGYKGKYTDEVLIVKLGNGELLEADHSLTGDEPQLIAKRLPDAVIILSRKRILGINRAAELGCDVALLDDGFQHYQVRRNLDIVLLNGTEDTMFPVGSLREPLSALQRAHVVCHPAGLNLNPGTKDYVQTAAPFIFDIRPLGFRSVSHLKFLADFQDVFLFSAIANPNRFEKTVTEMGKKIIHHAIFRDHHIFSDFELENILNAALDSAIVCTEKDWVKLPQWFTSRPNVFALIVQLELQEGDRFEELLLASLRK